MDNLQDANIQIDKFNRMIYSTEPTQNEILNMVKAWFAYSGDTECTFNNKQYKLIDNTYIIF